MPTWLSQTFFFFSKIFGAPGSGHVGIYFFYIYGDQSPYIKGIYFFFYMQEEEKIKVFRAISWWPIKYATGAMQKPQPMAAPPRLPPWVPSPSSRRGEGEEEEEKEEEKKKKEEKWVTNIKLLFANLPKDYQTKERVSYIKDNYMDKLNEVDLNEGGILDTWVVNIKNVLNKVYPQDFIIEKEEPRNNTIDVL